ncbi:MAG TPA: hypothetical protein VFL66_03280, partial [Gaiellaceae bacterium]|nr:hypothetical protein [Gaiellaceae bacterium]
MKAISGRRVEPPRPEVGRQLARVDPRLQRVRAAATEERRAAPLAHLAVEEHRQRELVADPARDAQRGGTRAFHVLGSQRDDGDDVRRPDARVHALVTA